MPENTRPSPCYDNVDNVVHSLAQSVCSLLNMRKLAASRQHGIDALHTDAESNAVEPEISRVSIPVPGVFPCGWMSPCSSIGCYQHLDKRIDVEFRIDLLLTTSPLLRVIPGSKPEAAAGCSLAWTPMARLALDRIISRNKRKQKHNTAQNKGLLQDMPGRLTWPVCSHHCTIYCCGLCSRPLAGSGCRPDKFISRLRLFMSQPTLRRRPYPAHRQDPHSLWESRCSHVVWTHHGGQVRTKTDIPLGVRAG